MDKLQIRNVLATPRGQNGVQWVCQPLEIGIDDRTCGVCRKHRLQPLATECANCHAKIQWDMG
jgi:hypothetical protein